MEREKIEQWLKQLTQIWHQTIPLAQFMGLEAVRFEQGRLMTKADLHQNLNLHNTMFAGSIYSHATLTGWGQVWLALQQAKLSGEIVLAEGHIKYMKPVAQLPICISDAISVDWGAFKKGKNVKIKLQVQLGDCALFVGQYVVKPVR